MQEVGQVVRFEGDIQDQLGGIGMFRVGDGHRVSMGVLSGRCQGGRQDGYNNKC